MRNRWTPYLVLTFFLSCCAAGNAAIISWRPVISIASSSDIYNPGAAGELHVAVDFSSDFLFVSPSDDSHINGIPFRKLLRASDVGPIYNSFRFFGSTAYRSSFWDTLTDDLDLDALLDGHWWKGSGSAPFDPAPAEIELHGLTVGKRYSVQLIGIADVRDIATANPPCCAQRTYEPDNGEGVYNTGRQLMRGAAHSIRGVFTADDVTQTILLRSVNGDVANNIDPGLSGFVAFELIPEPSTLMLTLLVSMVMKTRFRRVASY